jgi:predicted nucleotidyltransferase
MERSVVEERTGRRGRRGDRGRSGVFIEVDSKDKGEEIARDDWR